MANDPMPLEEQDASMGDVGGFSFGSRQRHFFHQMAGKNSPKSEADMVLWELAWKTALEEMLTETHTMLRLICEKMEIK